MKIQFDQLPENSKIWIYQSNRFLTKAEQLTLLKNAEIFTDTWQTHGADMHASIAILHDLFFVFGSDENVLQASGCAMDKLVHFVQQQGDVLKIDFFDRKKIAFTLNNEIKILDQNEFIEFANNQPQIADIKIFINLIDKKEQLKTSWKVNLQSSWLKRFLRKTAII